MSESKKELPHTMFMSAGDLSGPQAAETNKMMRALAEKYGAQTLIAGIQLANLTNLVGAMFHPRNCKLEGAEREKALKLAAMAVKDVIGMLAPAIGACCHEHVTACADAINAQTKHIEQEMLGEDLSTVEGEANSDLGKIMGRAAS